MFSLEKHISVIRKGPTMAPKLEMFPYEDVETPNAQGSYDRADVNIAIGDDAVINASFDGSRMHQSSNWAEILQPAGSFITGTTNGSNFNIR